MQALQYVFDAQLQNTIVLRAQPQQRGPLMQPWQFDLQRQNCQNKAHATFVQPLQYVLQHHVANPNVSTHMATPLPSVTTSLNHHVPRIVQACAWTHVFVLHRWAMDKRSLCTPVVSPCWHCQMAVNVCMYVCMGGWMDGWMDVCMCVCMSCNVK